MKGREKEEMRGKENENGKTKQVTHTHKITKKKEKTITAWVCPQDKPISFQIPNHKNNDIYVSTVKYTKLE